MRKAIVSELSGYTVRQVGLPKATDTKPYLVLKMRGDLRGVDAKWNQVEVWPYVALGHGLDLDSIVDDVVSRLHGESLERDDGTRFVLECTYIGDEYADDELKALTRVIRFRSPKVGQT